MITLVDGTVQEATAEAFANLKCFYKREDIKSVEIPAGVKTIRKESFFGCTNLTSVTIPYGVTAIEPSAFEGCLSLRFITLPESLKVLGEHAFKSTGLESVELPQRLKTVAPLVFNKCPNLAKMVVPEGYKASSIGVYADKVQQLVIPSGLEHICVKSPHPNWYHKLSSKNMGDLLAIIDSGASFLNPCCFYIEYYERIYGPFSTLREAYDKMRESIVTYAHDKDYMAYDTIPGGRGLLQDSIDPRDAELLAANIVVDFWKNPQMLEYSIMSPDDSIDCYPLKDYNPGDYIYIVGTYEWETGNFHPHYDLIDITTDEDDAKEQADESPAYRSSSLDIRSRECASIRILDPETGMYNGYVDGYEPDRGFENDEEEYDEESEDFEGDCSAHLIITQSFDPGKGALVKAEVAKAYFSEKAARNAMFMLFHDALDSYDSEKGEGVYAFDYCYDEEHSTFGEYEPDDEYTFEDFKEDYGDKWPIWTKSNHLQQFSLLTKHFWYGSPLQATKPNSHLYAVVKQSFSETFDKSDYIYDNIGNFLIDILPSKEHAIDLMHSQFQKDKEFNEGLVINFDGQKSTMHILKEEEHDDICYFAYGDGTDSGVIDQFSVLEFHFESADNELCLLWDRGFPDDL